MVKLFPNVTGYSKLARIIEAQKAYLMKTIKEHELSYDPEHMRDFIDVYLKQVILIDKIRYTISISYC